MGTAPDPRCEALRVDVGPNVPQRGPAYVPWAPFLTPLLPWPLSVPQDLTLKLCLIRSVCMICRAVCANAQSGDFIFTRKAELVSQMMVRGRGRVRLKAGGAAGVCVSLVPQKWPSVCP